VKRALSLKMRAITLLSQREHSVVELRRKLMRIARELARDVAAAQPIGSDLTGAADGVDERDADVQASPAKLEAEVEQLLVWLQAQGYLDDTRFVESRLHARSQRYGSLRIKQELAQHGLSLSAENQAALKACELERARAIWQRKFGGVTPADPALQAKQIRFLSARGFAPDLIRRLLRAGEEE
jgi:regulatory protein